MIKINNKQQLILLLLFSVLLITGCEVEDEVEEDIIIGNWATSSFEKYENLDCTGELESTNMGFGYTETYTFTEDSSFTWTGGSITEVGSYAIDDSVYTLSGFGPVHGNRVGKLTSETSMNIILQWNEEEDPFDLLDTCYKLTFDKID